MAQRKKLSSVTIKNIPSEYVFMFNKLIQHRDSSECSADKRTELFIELVRGEVNRTHNEQFLLDLYWGRFPT